ncbi:histidinol dehydrogenase [Acidiferrimicrobium sp. IK]|uniref:histidinol dehydrogenase n=1 Tax=Acidiferrimicrobium sp. IK TaxID=2871700 RepID=UPI0021CB839E|nr:histidinol dehydrogenase [Acidiferrimicrobium sp. IK]MCU4183630.1 histidinol dehydrogenase [Acidiferrimicrobium sp. IK]
MAPLLTRIDVRSATGDLRSLLPAPELGEEGPIEAVRAILAEVRAGRDRAVRDLTERFDKVRIDDLAVSAADIKAALDAVPGELRRALEVAAANIEAYHRSTLHADGRYERDGVTVREVRQPVERAGCYVPGGRAPLASTVLMTAIPARVAGVKGIAVCSPPGPDGKVADSVLAAAAVAGVDEVYRVGGAQAIGALAYGTETVAPVDVIVGPGNVYVAIAQRLVAQQGAVGVPSAFAGPSEVAVIADDTTPVDLAAIDLVVQAEHGPDGLAWLVTWSDRAADAISEAVERMTAVSPRRAEIESTLLKGGYAVVVDGPEQAMEVANIIAAEHLEIMTSDPESLVGQVRAAGAVFLGTNAPASVGDYAAGPSHVLPTARSARFGSALRCDDFCRHIHVVDLDQSALDALAPHVAAIATAEGLAAHAESVWLRATDRPTGSRRP